MEDSYVFTNRKRSANCNFDDNREPVLEESSSSSADHQKRMKLMPTIRDFSTMLSSFDTSLSFAQRKETAIQNIQTYTKAMQERYQQMIPFTNETEITIILHSLQNVIPISTTATTTSTTCNDVDHHEAVHDDVDDDDKSMNKMLQELQDRILPHFAHVSHKNWTMTGENAQQWHTYLFPYSKSPNHIASQFQSQQRHMFERIYREGNWDAAVLHQQQQSQNAINSNNVNKAAIPKLKPWAALVTGVNGIRKTTSIYQDWFPSLLREAIVLPPSEANSGTNAMNLELSNLPCGSNTFFRQLDHMIATLCNEEFIRLYTYTRDMVVVDIDGNGMTQLEQPSSDIIQHYSNMKAAIFSRYRTISELLGVILLREAQRIPINCMVETSGRDVAMFHYIDHFFPAATYNKLALHFTINDLQHAKTSVDQRMIDEIQSGIAALDKNNIFDIINANVGGPYGSEVLSDIQADSDRVWTEKVMVDDGGLGHDWYKATIQINAHATEPWTAQAVKRDGSLGTIFQFQRK